MSKCLQILKGMSYPRNLFLPLRILTIENYYYNHQPFAVRFIALTSLPVFQEGYTLGPSLFRTATQHFS